MDKLKDGALTRKMRLHKILEFVKENPELSEKQLKTKIGFETGLTVHRAEIYIEELKQAGKIRADSGKIALTNDKGELKVD
jgi:predicted transcriptional regulator